MRQPSSRMIPNTVIVFGAALWTSEDTDGSPSRQDNGGTTFRCVIAVDSEDIREGTSGTILSRDIYKLIFYQDPGVGSADVRIDWTSNINGPISPPLSLISLGSSNQPNGRCDQWIVRATLRT